MELEIIINHQDHRRWSSRHPGTISSANGQDRYN